VDKTYSQKEITLDCLHPSLRETFVSLPGGDSMLTPEQLDSLFGGDRRALRDMAQLIFKTDKTDDNKVR